MAMVLTDIAVINLALTVAYYVRFIRTDVLPAPLVYHPYGQYLGFSLAMSTLVPIIFFFQGLYRIDRNASRVDELWRITTSVSLATVLVVSGSTLLAAEFDYSRPLLSILWILSIVFAWSARIAQRLIHNWLRTNGVGRERLLIVGTGDVARSVEDKIRWAPWLGYETVGFIQTNGSLPEEWQGPPILGGLAEVHELVRQHGIRELIVADPALSHRDVLEVLTHCERDQVNIKVFPDVFQIIASEVSISDLNGLPMVTIRDVALRGWNIAIKRAFDVLVSTGVLVLCSGPMMLIALLIKLTEPRHPVFFVQERVGLDGKPFRMVKFRSMRPDAEAGSGPVWAHRGDARATPLGRILRRFSLDEWPQFINVLLGEMSIVGPRPERPYFVEQFSQRIPRYLDRHREKAGITGWAQVNGLRGDVSVEERTAYDLWYVENWTLGLDLKICLRTLFTVLRGENAY